MGFNDGVWLLAGLGPKMSLAESLKICHDLNAPIVVVAGHEPRDIAMNITLTAEHAD